MSNAPNEVHKVLASPSQPYDFGSVLDAFQFDLRWRLAAHCLVASFDGWMDGWSMDVCMGGWII